MVLLHGIPGSGASWHDVATRLAGRGATALVPDLLGFGASPRPLGIAALGADAQAAALVQALDERRVGRFAVAGHDFGGPVAAWTLRHAPDRVTHLSLAATNAFPDSPVPLPIRAVTWPVLGRPAAALLFSAPALRLMVRQAAQEPVDVARAVGDARQARAIATIFAASLRELPERYAPVRDALAAATVPTLVAWGERDPFFSLAQARRTADLVPGARLEVYAGCGHFVPEERPLELADDLAALLSGGAPPGAGPLEARSAPSASSGTEGATVAR